MKPIRVEFQAFGPYAGHEVVDFEALASQGLFLICGKTGTGKSMILDAVTFALYGKSSGHGRDDFEAMRCTNAAPDTKTFVKFEFENNGKRYLFERRIELKRKNFATSYNVSEKGENGEWLPLLENAKEKALNDKAVELIGLEYEQFRQIIILPQGQFEKFLTSGSEEKEKILTTLFGEEKWQGYAEALFQETSERKDALKAKKQRIAGSLAEENCGSMEELEALIQKKEEGLADLENAFLASDADGNLEKLQKLLVLSKRFGDLRQAEKKHLELIGQKESRDASEQRAKDAARAEKVRGLLEEAEKAKSMLQVRRQEEEKARVLAEKARQAAGQAEEALKQHLLMEPEVEERKTKRIQYAGKRAFYEGLDQVGRELGAKREEEKRAKRQELLAKQSHDEYLPRIEKAREDYANLNQAHQELLELYLAGITGELARDLTEGKECPVCGSKTHPRLAVVSDNNVTRAMVDQKKAEAEKQYQVLQSLTEEQEKAKALLEQRQKATIDVHSEVALIAAKLENMQQNLVEGISALGELDAAIAKLDGEVKAFGDRKAMLENAEKTAKVAHADANAKIQPAEKETSDAQLLLDGAAKAVGQGLLENQFASEEEARSLLLDERETERLRRQVADYDASLKAAAEALQTLQAELSGFEEPNEQQCREKQSDVLEAKSKYAEQRGILKDQITRLKAKAENLKSEGDGIDEQLREAEEDYNFAKKLRGDAGTGLRRYVLGIRFSSVVAAANKMLEMVHGGRYRLYRSDEKAQGSNKRGLELKVKDSHSEEHEGRFVSTLSGGEKFLTSLALSIGMSLIAQRSGIQMEALFIDEGFGTLDDDSIGDAMDILNSIQEAHGLVGIISHVQLLQDRIPSKLKVEITDDPKKGSHLEQSIG